MFIFSFGNQGCHYKINKIQGIIVMGNKCQHVCENIGNDRTQQFIQKSQKQWVRSLDTKKAQKHIVSAKTQKQQQRSYYLIHDSQQYTRGIIFTDNSFYEGSLQGNVAQGKGLQKFIIQGQKGDEMKGWYEGQFKNNTRDGTGVYNDEYLQYKGKWKNGDPIQGELKVYKNTFNRNTAITKGRQLNIYTLQMLHFNNKQCSTGNIRIKFPDKTVYEGQIVRKINNRFFVQGIGTMYMPNGDTYNGQFINGKFNGDGKYTWQGSKKIYQGQFKNGLRNGLGKFYITGNKYMEGKWFNGSKQGVHKVVQINSMGAKVNLCELLFQNNNLVSENNRQVNEKINKI